MRSLNIISICCVLFLLTGCAQLTKAGKTVAKVPKMMANGAKAVVKKTATVIKKTPQALAKTPEVIAKTPQAIMKTPAALKEVGKTIWGSSTRVLEKARVDAISKDYRCDLDDCFDAVLDLASVSDDPADSVGQGGFFNVFINDRVKQHIVVMGVEGSVDTTQVGIFFSQPSVTTVKIEVASRSSSAKRRISEVVFDVLDLRFSEVR